MLLQAQQRSTRIDHNTLTMFPTAQQSLQTISGGGGVGVGLGGILTSNSSTNYPHAMDCEPSPQINSSGTNSWINTPTYGGGNGGGGLSGVSQHPHNNKSRYPIVGHTKNLLSNFAPTSLPIDLGQVGVSSTIEQNLSGVGGYQHHLSGSGMVGSYAPFSMNEGGPMQMTQISQMSKSSSRSNGSNERDESPMVGVIQQSPVVIH